MTGRTFTVMFLAAFLSGCGPLFNEVYFTSKRIQSRDWAPHGASYTPKRVYCYKSLAGADCYDEEQPKRRNQLIEAYDQTTVLSENKTYENRSLTSPILLNSHRE